jgi:hypothetical protein
MCFRRAFVHEGRLGLSKPADYGWVFHTERFAEGTLRSYENNFGEVNESLLSDLCSILLASGSATASGRSPVTCLSIGTLCSEGGNPAAGQDYAQHVPPFLLASDPGSPYMNLSRALGMLRRSCSRPRNLNITINMLMVMLRS